MSVGTMAPASTATVWHNLRGPLATLSVGLVVLGLLFHVEIVAAVEVWIDSTAYNHCFLVLPLVAYLLWDRRATLQGTAAKPFPLAALAGVPLVFAWLFAERVGIMEGRQLVAVSFAEIMFFTVLGPRLWWRIAGPLLYLYFLVPFGAFLTPLLQDITTVFVRHGLAIIGIPAFIDGYIIEIPEGTFLIAEACAGLRFLIAAIAFGCLYALVMYRSPIRRVLFITASVVVPVIANGFRALGIVALGHVLGSAQAAAADHVLYGWIFFSIVILLLIAIGLPFREDQQPYAVDPTPFLPGGEKPHGAWFACAVLVVLAAIGPAAAAQLNRLASPEVAADFPMLVTSPVCIVQSPAAVDGVPGRMRMQRVTCGETVFTLTVEVFSPRATANLFITEQRRLSGEQEAEDAESRPLPLPDAPAGAWRTVVTVDPVQAAATSLWVQGKPSQGGLRMRLRQAEYSLSGSRYSPVLAVVTLDPATAAKLGKARALRVVTAFVQAHPGLNEMLERLAGSEGSGNSDQQR